MAPDSAFAFQSVQLGKVRSQGFEASATTSLAEGLNLIASYTLYGLRTIEGTGEGVGRVPVGIPETFASLWADYTIPVGDWKGFGFGGGVNYVGRSYADVANNLKVPEYVTFDAAVHYERDGWRAAVNIKNAGDKRFVASCSNATSCFYGTQRRIIASLGYRR